LNADGEKKFRQGEWLISTILLEINQLGGETSRNVSQGLWVAQRFTAAV
jgi:hypothetical protein